MKQSCLKITIKLFVVLFLFVSCAKEEPEITEEEPVNTSPPIFNWKLNNTSNFSSDSTFCYPSFTTIYAFKNGLANTIEINLSSFATGSYTISSATGNALTLVASGNTYAASAGKVTIASNSGGKLSGIVTASFSTGTVTTLSGEFTDIKQR